MRLRLFLKTSAVKFTKNLIKSRENYPAIKINSFLKSVKMEPIKKKPKLVLEECELLISINKKGECSFDVMSKVETVFKGRSQGYSGFSGSGNDSVPTRITDDSIKDNDIESKPDVSDETVDQSIENREKDNSIPPTSKYVSLDCEFVGIRGDISALGRCSIVDYDENVICDIYAWPEEKIMNYRTKYSGITKQDMKRAIPLESALSQISDIIKDKIVVGHGIHNDFNVLGFGHPNHMVRDTQKCQLLRDKVKQEKGGLVSLKNMAKVLLDKEIQQKSHCSVIDATVTMQLFKLVREEWETKLLNDKEKKSKLPDDQDQSPDHMAVTMAAEEKSDSNKVTKDNDGRINKCQKRKRKGKSLGTHFGQIIAGCKNINDYFKEDVKVLKNGQKKDPKHFEKTFSESVSNVNTSNKVDKKVTLSINVVEDVSAHTLRDGKIYQSMNICTDTEAKQTKLRKKLNLKKRKCNFESSEKLNLKNMYDQNIKQLFHDEFWNHMTTSA